MSKGSPSVPDPYATSDAQSAANLDAIKTSAKYSAVDQQAPWGSTTYTRDAAGAPTKQTIALGPGEQQNYADTLAAKNALAARAGTMAGGLPTSPFTMPDNTRPDAVQSALFNRRLAMVQPGLDEADNSIKVMLAERGIPIGSEVYNREMDRLSRNRADTLANISGDATLASGQESDRMLQQALTMRNQPYNEIGSLLSGAAGTPMPTFQNNPSFQAAAPDVAGNVYKSYQAQQGQNNSANQGLFGLLSSLGSMFAYSDRRLKRDIRRVGTTDAGVPIYTFRYTNGGPVTMGVMADEAEEKFPDAVITVGQERVKMVDYGRIG